MMKNYFHSCALIVLQSLPIRQNSSLDYDTVISLSATKVLGYSECTEYSHPWKAFVCSAVFWYTVPLIGWHTYSCTPPCNPLPCSEAYRAAQPTSRPVAQLHLLSRTPVYPAAGRHGISLNGPWLHSHAYKLMILLIAICIFTFYFCILGIKLSNVLNK